MSEFDKWFENEMPNSHKKVNKERIETVIYSCSEASWDFQQSKIDNLQKENDRLNIWYKNVKLQLENKQIDCDRLDGKVDELQARVKQGLKIAEDLMGEMQNYKLGESLENILKENEDEHN